MLSWLKGFFSTGTAADAGGRGEQLAAEWLQRERGFTIIARNWRSPRDRRDEIDLVARDGGALVFVEVKARAAESYLARLREKPRTFRLDVVEVILPAAGAEPGAPEILHFENVALFGKHFRG